MIGFLDFPSLGASLVGRAFEVAVDPKRGSEPGNGRNALSALGRRRGGRRCLGLGHRIGRPTCREIERGACEC